MSVREERRENMTSPGHYDAAPLEAVLTEFDGLTRCATPYCGGGGGPNFEHGKDGYWVDTHCRCGCENDREMLSEQDVLYLLRSGWTERHRGKLLATALGDLLVAIGGATAGVPLTGPQLLMLAEDAAEHFGSIAVAASVSGSPTSENEA